MRTLTDVFASRGPLLPEGLRTLEISPNRVVEPGMTVHAAFTFRNLGGGTAAGFRVRFRLPEGLTYLVGTARIDDSLVDEQGGLTTLLQSSGADIGEVPAGGERRISLAYTVATTIENGTPITLQAAIASFDVPVIGSNIVRLVVRSRPILQNAKTSLTLAPVREALPGEELLLNARVHNSGQSSAHDLIVLLPLPANTTYVPQSLRLEGRAPAGMSETEPFGFARPSIVAPTLGPGATIDIGYRVRIDSPLEDATLITAHGVACSQEVPEFALAPVVIKIPSAASFDGDDTQFRVECDDEVEPGQRIKVSLRAKNVGTARARNVQLKLALPAGVAYTPGSLCIDGAPAVDRAAESEAISLGDLEPGRSVEISLAGVVRSPVAHGHDLRFRAGVTWTKGKRAFERVVTARSTPQFPASFNKIEREAPRRLVPGDAATFTISLENLGTDVASDARLQLVADEGLEQLRVLEGDRELTIADGGVVHLDVLEPNVPRKVRVDARIAGVLEDQTQIRLRATVLTAQLAPVDLGAAVHTIGSRPRFSASTSHLAPEVNEALRPNRITTCRLVLANEGTDRGRDVRVTLYLPEELRLERVDGASPDGNAVVFGDILAAETREATLHFRLIGTVSDGDVLEVGARVGGLNVVPFALGPVEFATHAEASFAEGATLTSSPVESIDAGAEITYTLSLRNCGDGAAKRLMARVLAPTNAVYAPGSTAVNDIALQDYAGTSPLLNENGLTLADVGAGVEVIARWRVIVNTPLAPATPIETSAFVRWDDVAEITVPAAAVRVRSSSALPIVEPLLPFSVLGASAANMRPATLAQVTPGESHTYVALPPAVPVGSAAARPAGSRQGSEYAQLPPANGASRNATTTLSLELSDETLAWTVRYLEQTRVGGLVAHLLALRALFPDHVAGGTIDGRTQLRRYRELIGERADRLFVKVRLPSFTLGADDIETPQLRSSLVDLIESLSNSLPDEAPPTTGLRLVQTVEQRDLAAAVDALEREELVTVTPWLTMTLLIGTRLEREGELVADLAPYREALLHELAGHVQGSPADFAAALREPVASALDAQREALVQALSEHQRVVK